MVENNIITDISQLDLNKKYSYSDYLLWQFDEMVELIKGKIFRMSPAPTSNHQIISGNVFAKFHIFLEDKKCKIYPAPFDVRLPIKNQNADEDIYTVVQPDICIICDPEKVDRRGCLGAPDLIIEILSKSTSEIDRKDKYKIYEQAGVKEYWIVNPKEQTLLINTLVNDVYKPSRLFAKNEIVSTSIFKDFTLDLAKVFKDLIE